jgi:uncharacterized protein YndB with AHSA1/START domain
MKKQTIKKSIKINAPREIVWKVLLDEEYTRAWYGEFSEGSHAQTDWQVGSKAIFSDNSHCGLIGKVIANKPFELLSVEYTGQIVDGVEDYDSDVAKDVRGGLETYRLSGENGITHLAIECDMGEDFFEIMAQAWDRALQKIQQLTEAQKQLQS